MLGCLSVEAEANEAIADPRGVRCRPKADIALYLERGRRIRFLEWYWPPLQRLVCEVAETDAYPANE